MWQDVGFVTLSMFIVYDYDDLYVGKMLAVVPHGLLKDLSKCRVKFVCSSIRILGGMIERRV